MNRRSILAGLGSGVAVGVTGCLGDGDESGESDPEPDEDGDEEESVDRQSARAVSEAVIEATANGDDERARAYAPLEFLDRDDVGIYLLGEIGDEWSIVIDEITAIDCESEEYDEHLHDRIDGATDVTVTDAETLEYRFEFVRDGDPDARSLEVYAIEIDDEWYAWLFSGKLLGPEASVETDSHFSEPKIDIRLSTLGAADGVFVRGYGVDDPTAYHLTTPGEEVTVSYDPDASDSLIVYAYIGADPTDPEATNRIHIFRKVSSQPVDDPDDSEPSSR